MTQPGHSDCGLARSQPRRAGNSAHHQRGCGGQPSVCGAGDGGSPKSGSFAHYLCHPEHFFRQALSGRQLETLMSALTQTLQRAWMERGWLARLLWPLSRLYGALFGFRRWLFEHHWLRSHAANVPVVVVGNLVAGGADRPATSGVERCRSLETSTYRPRSHLRRCSLRS